MAVIIRKRIITLFCIISMLCTVVPVVYAEGEPKDVDVIVMGDNESEEMHELKSVGESSVTSVHESVGEYEVDHTVRKIDINSRISFYVNVLEDKELSLEVEEIHSMRRETFAYRVLVETEEVYFRSFYEESAGPNNYFIHVPRNVTAGKTKVKITIENSSNTYFTIKRIWAYSDWDSILEQEGAYSKMKLLTLMGNATPKETFPRKWDTIDSIKEKMDRRNEYFGTDYNMYEMGAAGELFYLRYTNQDNHRLWKELIEAGKEKNFPMSLGINSWWEGTPLGVYDGEGGFFDDIQYSQICYDPDETQKMGKFVLTTPNMWANTPWLTMNNPILNEARYGWYKKNLGEFSKAMAKLRMNNNNSAPYISLYTENEPMYWQLYTFAGAKNSNADFNSYATEAAKKDGIDLNPEDGLTKEEYEWLFKNINRNLVETSDAMAEGLGYDYILVDNGNVLYPESQMIDECYTHINPYKKLSEYSPGVENGMWEAAVTKNIHLGLEANHFMYKDKMTNDIASDMSYMASRGKFAQVNGESSLADGNPDSLKLYYTYGCKYYNDYNTLESHAGTIKLGDNCEDEPVSILDFNDRIFDYNFSEGITPSDGSPLYEIGNAVLGNAWRNTIMQKGEAAEENYALFKIDEDKPLSTGLEAEIYCGADNGGTVELYAGSSPEKLSLVETIDFWTCGARFDVSEFIDKTKKTAYIMVKCVPNGGYASVISVGALRPWKEKSGHTDGYLFNRKQMRTRYAYIGARADAEEMLDKYLQKGSADQYTEEASRLLACGRPFSAKQVLVRHISELLPAKFMVRGSGKLAKYPIEIKSDNPQAINNIVLTKFSDDLIEFSMDADIENNVEFKIELKKGNYKITIDDKIYTIRKCAPDEADAVNVGSINQNVKWAIEYSGLISGVEENNTDFLTFNANVRKEDSITFDKTFTAITTKPETNDYPKAIKLTMCDTMRYGHNEGYDFALAPDAVVRRRKNGGDFGEIEKAADAMNVIGKGELANVTLNDNNEISAIDITYGEITGKVVNVEEASLYPETKAAFIEVENIDGKKLKLEINSNTDLSESIKAVGGNMLMRAYDKKLGFEVNDVLTVKYLPLETSKDSYYSMKVTEGNIKSVLCDNFADPYFSVKRFDSSVNIKIADLDSTNRIKSAVTQSDGGSGEMCWEIKSGKPISGIIVKYSGRAIMGSDIEWYISSNGYNFTKVEEFVTGTSSIEDFMKVRTFSINDPKFMGRNTLYLSCKLNSVSNTWAALGSVEVYVQNQ